MIKLKRERPPFEVASLGGGAFMRLRPATSFEADQAAARVKHQLMGLVAGSEAAETLAGLLGPEFAVHGADGLDAGALGAAAQFLANAELVMLCQDGWSGIADENGVAIPAPDIGSVALLLRDAIVRDKIMRVVERGIHEASAEKNAFAASRSGEAATDDLPAAPVTKTAPTAPAGEPLTGDDALRSNTHP